MPTNKGIDKTLYSNAVLKSRFKIDEPSCHTTAKTRYAINVFYRA